MDRDTQPLDLVVIGAGWSGLAAARVHLQIHPDARLLVLDCQATIGGVWAKERLYPGLKTNNMYGSFEYPDFPMDASFGVKQGEHIPGPVLQEYLETYAKRSGVFERVRLNTWVDSVEEASMVSDNNRQGVNEQEKTSEWLISARTLGEPVQIYTKKLVVACGLTNVPNMPELPGAANFTGTLLHSKHFAANYTKIVQSKPSNVVILGSSKSAWDCAYLLANAGTTVHMIIRTSGNGATIFTNFPVVNMRRAVTLLSPCIWGEVDGYGWMRDMLHGTAIGRAVVNAFWGNMANDMNEAMGFDKHPATAKLTPSMNPFWIGSNLGFDNHDTDFLQLVRDGSIIIHHADPESLQERVVKLSDGNEVPADVMVCCTGWQATPPITFKGLTEKELGLPYHSREIDSRVAAADEDIFARFPKLREQPSQGPLASSNHDGENSEVHKEKINISFRLYKGMVPPAFIEKRNLAYAGHVWCIGNSITWHNQALWLTAFFDGKLPLPSQEDIEKETILHSQWGKWRAPLSRGALHLDLWLEALPYNDMILEQLGLEKWRKGGVIRELVVPYGPEDYRNVVDEWLEKNGR